MTEHANKLLRWYDEHRRVLPWREDPAPYHVWLSEIMLQQTRVEAVKGYYERFLEALPDIRALAEAEEDVYLKLWEGLGYYSRVRNLHRAAVQVMEEYGGELPGTAEELRQLPGIGLLSREIAAQPFFGCIKDRQLGFGGCFVPDTVQKVFLPLQPKTDQRVAVAGQHDAAHGRRDRLAVIHCSHLRLILL